MHRMRRCFITIVGLSFNWGYLRSHKEEEMSLSSHSTLLVMKRTKAWVRTCCSSCRDWTKKIGDVENFAGAKIGTNPVL
jgi:hypothetical protein